MARGRMISKSLGCGSKKFARLRSEHPTIGLFAQALYPLIVANSDDFGRQKGDAFTVKHAVWSTAPEAEVTFGQALEAMSAVGLLLRYDADGETYIQIVDFERHQQGIHKRTSSLFPNPPDIPGDRIVSPSRNPPEIPESPGDSLLTELNLTEQNRTEPSNARAPGIHTEQRQCFEQFWSRYPRQEGIEPAWAMWQLNNPTDQHAAEITEAARAYAASKGVLSALDRGETQFIKFASNWLKEGRWVDTPASARRPALPCRHRHDPPCLDDVACTSRYLVALSGSGAEGSPAREATP